MAEFKEPTYEEYKRASSFARFRYKYGLFVTAACWLCLVFIIVYMILHAEVLASNPLVYGTKEAGIQCECTGNSGTNSYIHFFVNGSSMWLPGFVQENSYQMSKEELAELFVRLEGK